MYRIVGRPMKSAALRSAPLPTSGKVNSGGLEPTPLLPLSDMSDMRTPYSMEGT
jgi:hypothetical protein